jgi:hypothetical protein
LELAKQHDPGSLLERIVAAVGTSVIVITRCNSGDRYHCWMTTVTADHIATMSLDVIVSFDTVVFAILSS